MYDFSYHSISEQDKKLNEAIATIDQKARDLGLEHIDTIFEIVSQDRMRELSSYIIPIRYHHWTFGREYYKARTLDKYGQGGRLYEMVINSNPAYAWLLDQNTLTENKLVVAHVFGHVDFSENNILYQATDKKIISTCAQNAEIISEYSFKYGEEIVERWIDACLTLSWNINLNPVINKEYKWMHRGNSEDLKRELPELLDSMDNFEPLFVAERIKEMLIMRQMTQNPEPIMEVDLLLFFLHEAKNLSKWQRDIMAIIHEEQNYFRPNIQTHIVNEGWATWWHKKILTDLDVEQDFLKENGEDMFYKFLSMHSNVAAPIRKGALHPYFVGYKMWDYMYRGLMNPTEKFKKHHNIDRALTEKEAIERMKMYRSFSTNSSFFRDFLDETLVEELDLFNFRLIDDEWVVTENNWRSIRDNLTNMLSNAGQPRIYVVDDNYKDQGELYLIQDFDGHIMDDTSIRKTLDYVGKIWIKPVHLEVVDRTNDEYSFNTKTGMKKFSPGDEYCKVYTYRGTKDDIEIRDLPIFPRSIEDRGRIIVGDTSRKIRENKRAIEKKVNNVIF